MVCMNIKPLSELSHSIDAPRVFYDTEGMTTMRDAHDASPQLKLPE